MLSDIAKLTGVFVINTFIDGEYISILCVVLR